MVRPERFAYPRGMKFPAALLALLLTACASPVTRTVTPRFERAAEPAELATLDMLVGTWEGTSESTLAENGTVLQLRAITRVQWDVGGQFIQERTAIEIDGFPPVGAMGMWTFDDTTGEYRLWRFDSSGATHEGTMTYDPETRTMNMRTEVFERGQVFPSVGEGFMRFVSDDEKVYEWTVFAPDSDEVVNKTVGRSRRVAR